MRTAGDPSKRFVVVVVDDDRELIVDFIPGPPPDLGLVDALARLELAARRHGFSLKLRRPCSELLDLIELVGLAGVLAGRRA